MIKRDAFNVWQAILVRWGDMDAYGHVNNAQYFTYCESARMRYFADIDLESHKGADSHGPALAHADLDFRRQVHHPAELDAGARCSRIGSKSFNLDYAIFAKGEDHVVADGSSVIVWVDYATGSAIPLPDSLKESIRRLDTISKR